MTEDAGADPIKLDSVQAILTEGGYETEVAGENTLRIKELESGIVLHAALEDTILFSSVTCTTVPADAITAELMKKMLEAENGISTSGFQLYTTQDGNVAITLNNFCKLQAMGEDDRDDILSCLEFLVVDVLSAKDLIGEHVAPAATATK